jgi:predicted enzyme related to lactoylglutathione lyase
MTRARAVGIGTALLVAACAARTAPVSTTAPGSTDTIGKFVWHDLVSDDVPAARKFYSELLGWQFVESERRGKPYVVAHHHGRPMGGLVAIASVPDREVSRWIGYQSVPNVDEAVAAVEKRGGHTLIAPVNVNAGRAAVVTDPQGAPIGLVRLTAGDPADPPAPIEGTFFWMEYLARDPQAAADFYGGVFGFKREVTDRLANSEYIVLSRGHPRGGIVQAPNADIEPTWLPSLLVADPAPLVKRVAALGGKVLLEPRADIRRASVAVITDPSGAMLALQKFPF